MRVRPKNAGQEGARKVYKGIRIEDAPGHNPVPTGREDTDISRLQLFELGESCPNRAHN